MSSGATAVKRGTRLENLVEDLLAEEYQKVPAKKFFALTGLEQPIFARQCPVGIDVYGKSRRIDFIVFHPIKWPECLVIQCKWQSAKGSVEEKYPFEVLSIRENPYPTIIVLDGGGYTQAAEDWLRGQAKLHNLISVMNLGEITRYCSDGRL